jgi:hypothetical protein
MLNHAGLFKPPEEGRVQLLEPVELRLLIPSLP